MRDGVFVACWLSFNLAMVAYMAYDFHTIPACTQDCGLDVTVLIGRSAFIPRTDCENCTEIQWRSTSCP